MSRPLELENFDSALGGFVPDVIEGTRLEHERLAAYDEGYAAGWDDSSKAAEADLAQSEAQMRAHLQDLGFTFHEARAHVMRTVQPMLNAIVEKALPQLLHDTLGHRITADLTAMIEEAGDADITLLVASDQGDRVRNLLGGISSLPIDVHEESTLGAGELHLRLGHCEREIDLRALETTIGDALRALDTLNKETFAHG